MRVALLHHSYGTPYAGAAEPLMRELARALRAAGHDVVVIGSRPGRTRRYEEDGVPVVQVGRLPEGPLRSRAFDGPVTHIPNLLAELRGFEVAHGFSPQDAWAATYAPVGAAFTFVETPQRRSLSAKRLRLAFWERATGPEVGLIAAGEEQRAAARRWFAVEAEVLGAGDAAGHEHLYRRCRERACR